MGVLGKHMTNPPDYAELRTLLSIELSLESYETGG